MVLKYCFARGIFVCLFLLRRKCFVFTLNCVLRAGGVARLFLSQATSSEDPGQAMAAPSRVGADTFPVTAMYRFKLFPEIASQTSFLIRKCDFKLDLCKTWMSVLKLQLFHTVERRVSTHLIKLELFHTVEDRFLLNHSST